MSDMTLYIDGRKVTAEEGMTVLEAARRARQQKPHGMAPGLGGVDRGARALHDRDARQRQALARRHVPVRLYPDGKGSRRLAGLVVQV